MKNKLNRIRELGDGAHFKADVHAINEIFADVGAALKIEMEYIYTGEAPGDGTGDSLRSGCQKINRNFKRIEDTLNGAR